MGLLDTIKDLGVMVQKADNIHLNQKILELQAQVMAVLDENHRLKDEVRSLQEAAKFQGELQFEGNRYVRRVGDATEEYCSACWDGQSKAVRLQKNAGSVWCPICKRYLPGSRPHAHIPPSRSYSTGY